MYPVNIDNAHPFRSSNYINDTVIIIIVASALHAALICYLSIGSLLWPKPTPLNKNNSPTSVEI